MQPRSDANPGIGELLAHAEFLRAIARELCAEDPHGAEDLAQDVWVAALESPPRNPRRLAGWIAAVAHNLTSSRLRRKMARAARDASVPSDATASNELENAAVA